MKAGIVSSIRINPKDCQSILDVLDKAGVYTQGMSFASMVSLALGSLLEAARKDGIIPEPDPFQYLNRLQPYIKAKHARKLEVTKVLHNAGATLQAPPVTASLTEPQAEDAFASAVQLPTTGGGAGAPSAPEYSDEEIREASSRLTELLHKKDLVDAQAPGATWTDADTAEYVKVFNIVYPDG